MKHFALTLSTILIAGLVGFGQNKKPSVISNSALSFEQFISGVKYAEIGLNIPNQAQVDNQEGIAAFYNVAQKYLQQLGFEYVALTSAEKTEMEVSVRSYCEFTTVMFGGDIDKKSISNSTISFISCNGDIYSFQSDKKFTYGKFADVEKKLIEDWKSIVSTKGSYVAKNQLILPSNPTTWTTASVKNYIQGSSNSLKPVEGIYERVRLSFEDFAGGKYTIGIVKDSEADEYLIIYLSGARNSSDWKTGELKGKLYKTATPGFFTVDWITRDKSLYQDVYCTLDETGVSFYSSGMVPLAYKFVKTLPSKD